MSDHGVTSREKEPPGRVLARKPSPLGEAFRLYDADGRPVGGDGLAFTVEQADAVLRREGPMLLSANAGSGKTAVLAERFVRSVLEDGVAPGALLAITFTEKAAGELRARIRRRFTELGAREAARDMDGAWISTIHGFCARVLRAHAVTAGLDPAFTVLDEAVARQARAEAYTTALGRFLAPAAHGGPPPEDELELVATWGVDRLHDAIAAVHDGLRSTGMTHPSLPAAGERMSVDAALDAARSAAAAVQAERGGWREGLKSVDAAHDCLDALGTALEGGDDRAALRLLAGLKLDKRAKELKTEAVEALRDAAAAVAQAQVDAEAAAVLARLGRLLGLYATAYADAKRARSAVDYDDLELLTNDLLESAPAVAAAYRERFARIMVDEFQDTNPLQLQLVQHLDIGNVFLVGDALQSIYGFRHADVGVFREQRRRHEALGAAPALATNWRSSPPLLHTINAAFGDLHDDYVPLVAGLPGVAGDDGPRVQLLLVDDAHDDGETVDPVALAALKAGMPPARSVTVLAEARAVAAEVRALVDTGECSCGEVAILLRAASDLHVFERALELEGLATLASGGRGYWSRQQVQDLTSYLAALANPVDAPALLALLASPLVGVSSDGLALLAASGRSRGQGLWEVLAHGTDGLGLPAADAEAIATFVAWFTAERAQAPLLALDALITRAVHRTGYDLHVLALPGGRRRLANLHKLERLAAAFEEGHGRDVRAFIDHVAAEVAAQSREPEAPVELGDLEAVQLMTIHAAKGLEFGVVVVAGLGRSGQSGLPSILVHDQQVGLRLPRLHGTNEDALDYAALRTRANDAAIEEERRIMHVAFTRAERRLLVSGGVTLGKDWPKERAGGVPLGWVGTAIDPTLPYQLSQESPLVTLDRWHGPDRLQVDVRLVAAPGGAVEGGGGGPTSPSTSVPSAPPVVPDVVPGDIGPLAPSDGPRPGSDAPAEQLSLTVVEAESLPAHGRRGARSKAPGDGVPGAPPPATVSYSSLEDHARCGYRFYLRRSLGLPEQAPPLPGDDPYAEETALVSGLDPRVRGTIAHALLEAPNPSATTADDVREAGLDTGVELTDGEVDDLLRLVLAFGATSLAAEVATASSVRREEPFAFVLDDADPSAPLVNGFIDLAAVLPDETWLVVDYKSHQLTADADLDAVVALDYLTQRRIYALAALRAGAPAVRVAFLFLERPGEPVFSTYAATDAPALTAELVARAAPLRAGRFPVTDRPHRDLCLTCPGRGGMCSWPEAMTLRPAAAG